MNKKISTGLTRCRVPPRRHGMRDAPPWPPNDPMTAFKLIVVYKNKIKNSGPDEI